MVSIWQSRQSLSEGIRNRRYIYDKGIIYNPVPIRLP